MDGAPHRYHEDHIAGKGMKSISHNNLVRKFIPLPQAVKIPDAKAAVGKDWENLETIPAWQLTKVKNKMEVIAEARNKGITVHFSSLMDLCLSRIWSWNLNFRNTKVESCSEVTS